MQTRKTSLERGSKGEVGSLSQVLNAETLMEDVNPPLVRVRDLDVTFTKQRGFVRRETLKIHAVKKVSFDIYESEVFAIVGESGSGKTTIARCLSALTKPSGGKIEWKGEDKTSMLGRTLKEYRRNVQIVYQDPYESLNPRQDVFKAISAPILHLTDERDPGKVRRMVANLLGEVGLNPDEHMHRLPHQLSGGERQRVNIARALAPNPKLLIADEPTTMLDASQRFNVISLLIQLRAKRKLSILMITHDMSSARLASDRILVMYLGKLVEVGQSQSIFAKPHHPYTELILTSTPGLQTTAQLGEDQTSSAVLEESLDVTQGCIFRPRCKYATQVCASVEPELLEKSRAHLAACHNPLNA